MSNSPKFIAPQDHHVVNPNKLRRDTRPFFMSMIDMIMSSQGIFLLMTFFGLAAFMFPSATLPIFILGLITVSIIWAVVVSNKKKYYTLPLRLPTDANMIDYGSPKPGRNSYNKSMGAVYVGNDYQGREIWSGFTDELTHGMVLGGTGAGKTETLVSQSFNAIALGGGLGYVDAKAAPKLYGQLWVSARFAGRDDHMRVLNFATGQEELIKTPRWRSNSIQPFSIGKAESLQEIPLSLMAGGGDSGGGNAIFASNGKALMTALMKALVEMRNKGEIYLYPEDIVKYMQPMEFVQLAKRPDFKPETKAAIQNFLKSMGWKPDIDDSSKWGDFDRQYSYAQNYFLEAFSTMNNNYRHIFAQPIGDIVLPDVILQRRIFVALIPSLEKSKKELESIGRITLAALRLATAVGLGGGDIMGQWKRLIDMGIANSRVPFFLKVDELAAIMIEGFAEIFTQGRGLGIACTVGSQDWAGMQGANEITKKESQQILSNSKLKYFMTGDDPKETKSLIQELAGEDEEMRTQGFQVTGVLNYYDNLSAQAQKVSRVNQRDISQQIEGEWHLFYKDKIIRGQGFHAGAAPASVEDPLFVHHFLQVRRPEYATLSARYGDLGKTLEEWNKIAMSEDPIDEESNDKSPKLLAEIMSKPGPFEDSRRELAAVAIYAASQYDPFSALSGGDGGMPASTKKNEEPKVSNKVGEVNEADEDEDLDITTDEKEDIRSAIEDIEDDYEGLTADDVADEGFDPDEDILPGAESFNLAIASVVGDIEDDDIDIDIEDDVEDMNGELKEAVQSSVKEPPYPSEPKPEKADPTKFANDTRAWLDNLKKRQS